MIRGAMSVSGITAPYFLPSKTSMNGSRYFNLLEKFKIHMYVHRYSLFMYNSAPFTLMVIKKYLTRRENRSDRIAK